MVYGLYGWFLGLKVTFLSAEAGMSSRLQKTESPTLGVKKTSYPSTGVWFLHYHPEVNGSRGSRTCVGFSLTADPRADRRRFVGGGTPASSL